MQLPSKEFLTFLEEASREQLREALRGMVGSLTKEVIDANSLDARLEKAVEMTGEYVTEMNLYVQAIMKDCEEDAAHKHAAAISLTTSAFIRKINTMFDEEKKLCQLLQKTPYSPGNTIVH